MRFIATLSLVLAIVVAPASKARAAGFADVAEAMAAGDWDVATSLAADMDDAEAATTLVMWTRLRAGTGTFPEYVAFLDAYPDWPQADILRAAGERRIPEETPAAEVLAYFDSYAPQRGVGAVRLAAALTATGEPEAAEAVIRDAWVTLGLYDDGFAAMMEAHGEMLAPLHAQRVDAMLWRWRTSDASRLLDALDEDQRALAEARIALITGAGDANEKIAAVPTALANNPGLAYDMFNELADAGDYSDATALITRHTGSAEELGQPFRWASWRASIARWAMREGRPRAAYALAAQHQMSGEDRFTSAYSDLEWLSGYLALTYLDNATLALDHFRAVEEVAETPITIARAGYWVGRAQEELGDAEAAQTAFATAADYQTAFYGLLAAERLGRPLDPALTGREEFPDWREAAWRAEPMGRALEMLLEDGDRTSRIRFVAHLARTLDRTGTAQLGAMLAEREEPYLTVLAGKAAAARGMVLPAMYFPLHPIAETDLPTSPALALAIARRESEFNHTVGSPVGALGLMQLMPGTAAEVARELGLPYSRARLTNGWEYNAILGSQYLANLRDQFGNSPVMIAAGYNAGPSRPRTWMTQRGDPRKGEVDVIDWIEHIPFNETRNYVMRVTESLPVYEARLSGETGPIEFTALLNGAPPFIRPFSREDAARPPREFDLPFLPETRPLSRPDTITAPTAPVAPQAPGGPVAPQAPGGIRPISRP